MSNRVYPYIAPFELLTKAVSIFVQFFILKFTRLVSIAYADARKMVIDPFTEGTTLISFVRRVYEKEPQCEGLSYMNSKYGEKKGIAVATFIEEEKENLKCLSLLVGNRFVDYWIVKTPRKQQRWVKQYHIPVVWVNGRPAISVAQFDDWWNQMQKEARSKWGKK